MRKKIIFGGLCALLIFLPPAFGAVDEWAILIFEAGTLVLFGLHLARKKSDLEQEPIRLPFSWKIFLTLFFAVSIFQLIPLPSGLLKILSPHSFEIYQGIRQSGLTDVSTQGWMAISFSSNLSLYELIKYACYTLFDYLVFHYVRTRKDIEILVIVMIASGLFQSVYGLGEYFSGTYRIFGWKNRYNIGSAFGTFVNRDHFSGFLEMVFPLCIGYLLAKADFFVLKKRLSFREKILWLGQEQLQKSVVLGLLAVVMGIAIFFSRSRSGVLIFFITIFLMIVTLSLKREEKEIKKFREKRFKLIVRTIALVIMFSLVLIGIKPILERFTKESIGKSGRPTFYKNTIHLIEAFPLFGTGLGTYVHAYTMFEKMFEPGILDHAHNDYLEVLAESGFVGGVPLFLLAFGALGYLLSNWMKRRDYFVKGIAFGCLAGIAALLIHSLTDFNLRIPANAVYFITLYALGIRTVITRQEPSLRP